MEVFQPWARLRLPLCLLIAGFAAAAQTNPSVVDTQSEIRDLKEQLLRISQRLTELEQHQGTAAAQQASPNTSAEALPPQQTVTPPPVASQPVAPVEDDSIKPKWKQSFDVSGYYLSSYTRTGLSGEESSYQSHTVSLFLGKSLGNWNFHSEMEFDYRPDLINGLKPVVPYTGSINIETAWLNYKSQDWLNVRAGLLMLPTYWRLHNYPSTTLTVQAPLLEENIFPPTVAGVMIHGSKYGEEGGFTYNLYAGEGREFDDAHDNSRNAMGATFITHVPTKHLFDVFDVGVHHYRDEITAGNRRIWGFEEHIERGRLGWLSEYAHSRFGSGENRDLLQGYYLQPYVRLTGNLYGVYRYDRITQKSDNPSGDRHTAGLVFRPIPELALKLEYNRYPAQSSLPARNGMAAAVSIFAQ